MVKLTVLYNLPPDMDAEEFEHWRINVHQGENASAPGVVRTDFYIAENNPDGSQPRYRYITECWWETMAELHASFFSEKSMAQWAKDGERFTDRLFLVSEEKAVTVQPKTRQ